MPRIDDDVRVMARVQALRAAPPHAAGSDARRRQVFGAALQQFDELLAAARAAGVASTPLPTFYALSQAGRAIAAARCPDGKWDFKGHGLKVVEDPDRVERSTVECAGKGKDAFSVVAEATGSPKPSGRIKLETLWASLPLPSTARLGDELPRPLPVFPYLDHVGIVKEPIGKPEQSWQEKLAPYPRAVDLECTDSSGIELRLYLPTAGDSRAPIQDWTTSYATGRYLWPGVGTAHTVLSPLMTWWALLITLSHLARYVPAAWTQALDKDASQLAVPIEEGLETAHRVLPRLVFNAITGEWL